MLESLMKHRIEQNEKFLACWADIEVEEIEKEFSGFVHFKRGELSAIKDEIAFLTHALSKIKQT
jgi:hypothetical protein